MGRKALTLEDKLNTLRAEREMQKGSPLSFEEKLHALFGLYIAHLKKQAQKAKRAYAKEPTAQNQMVRDAKESAVAHIQDVYEVLKKI